MNTRKLGQVAAILVAVCLSSSLRAGELPRLQICDHQTTSELHALVEASTEQLVTSGMGVHTGEALSRMALAWPKGYLVREIGVASGYVLVWAFRLSEPFSVAVGFIFIPTPTAKCDTLDSSDLECANRRPCIYPPSDSIPPGLDPNRQ